MTRLRLRTFAISIILVSTTLGLGINFTSEVLSNSETEFKEEDEINNLRENFSTKANEFKATQEEAAGANVQTDFFFIPEIWNTIKTVLGGVSNIGDFVGAAFNATGLNIPGAIKNLFGVVVIGVVFAVLAAARGWDV